MTGSSPERTRPRVRRWIWVTALLAAAIALIDVRVTGPRVSVRWADATSADRPALEERYGLLNGRPGEGPEWLYELGDWSEENIAALVGDPAVADTGYIDRSEFRAEEPITTVGVRPLPFPFSTDEGFAGPGALFHIQTLWLVLAGGTLMAAARLRQPTRRALAVSALLGLAVVSQVFPLEVEPGRMGDFTTYTGDQSSFEGYVGVREIRFEAHLSHAILGRLYELLGRTAESPTRAFAILARGAMAWFLVSCLAVGFVERWSATVVRYLSLAVMAPAALMYFGYRELGYLSLNVAAYPLLVRGFSGDRGRLETGSALAGIGAALHGFGLLSVVGSWIAAPASRGTAPERIRRLLVCVAWGTAAYLGWIALYVIVLQLPVSQGHAEDIPWRPWFTSELVGDRVNVAIFSGAGARDLLFTAWVVGAPLLMVAASLWRAHREDVKLALLYSVPSLVFSVLFWPIQGLGAELDLVVAAFPAFFALAWVCAHRERQSVIAALLLASAHIAFFRMLLDERFVN